MRNAVFVIIGLFLIIQFIPVERDNPPSARKSSGIRRKHGAWSNGPVLIARGHLNFSEWDQLNEDFDEIKKVISRGEMPLSDYLLMHPEAELSDTEKQPLIDGLQATWPTIYRSSSKSRDGPSRQAKG